MQIETYSGKYDDEIIALILGIQNNESKIGLMLKEKHCAIMKNFFVKKNTAHKKQGLPCTV